MKISYELDGNIENVIAKAILPSFDNNNLILYGEKGAYIKTITVKSLVSIEVVR